MSRKRDRSDDHERLPSGQAESLVIEQPPAIAPTVPDLTVVSEVNAQIEPQWFKLWRERNDRTLSTITADMSTLKTDVNTLKTDVNTLKTDVNTLKTGANTMMSMLDLLIGSTPAAFEDFATPFVAPSANPSQDQIDGTSATYTFVEREGSYFAIGAAHCAFYFPKHFDNDLCFVQLPESVLQCGVEAVYRSRNLSAASTPEQHWQNDFVVVELKSKPQDRDGAPWPPSFAADAGDLGPAFGWSSSGPVTGTNIPSRSASWRSPENLVTRGR